MIPIDPMTALAGIQSAISMVKKASKVANDLSSLAPMIGKMFDAKSTATKALIETKKNKGSNMGTALQIEMALEQARAFEEELKMLFMQSGKIDVSFNSANKHGNQQKSVTIYTNTKDGVESLYITASIKE
jgi:hypothetical protein